MKKPHNPITETLEIPSFLNKAFLYLNIDISFPPNINESHYIKTLVRSNLYPQTVLLSQILLQIIPKTLFLQIRIEDIIIIVSKMSSTGNLAELFVHEINDSWSLKSSNTNASDKDIE